MDTYVHSSEEGGGTLLEGEENRHLSTINYKGEILKTLKIRILVLCFLNDAQLFSLKSLSATLYIFRIIGSVGQALNCSSLSFQHLLFTCALNLTRA